ncbi:hypothetical protein FA088_21535 [Pseudomonas aeruginosa]|nr:hypothetical protein [Pseudomonas aeruginosa]RTT28588.1 hypothetical protein DY953_00640 [Pseudomonas aeruginosa]
MPCSSWKSFCALAMASSYSLMVLSKEPCFGSFRPLPPEPSPPSPPVPPLEPDPSPSPPLLPSPPGVVPQSLPTWP